MPVVVVAIVAVQAIVLHNVDEAVTVEIPEGRSRKNADRSKIHRLGRVNEETLAVVQKKVVGEVGTGRVRNVDGRRDEKIQVVVVVDIHQVGQARSTRLQTYCLEDVQECPFSCLQEHERAPLPCTQAAPHRFSGRKSRPERPADGLGNIQITIVVDVAHRRTRGLAWIADLGGRRVAESTLSVVQKQSILGLKDGHVDIGPAITVEIRGREAAQP